MKPKDSTRFPNAKTTNHINYLPCTFLKKRYSINSSFLRRFNSFFQLPMTNSIFIDSDVSIYILHRVNQSQQGYQTVTIGDLSERIQSLKFVSFFGQKKQFYSFMVSNFLVDKYGSAKAIVLNILLYRFRKFRLKFRGSVESLFNDLGLVPNSSINCIALNE